MTPPAFLRRAASGRASACRGAPLRPCAIKMRPRGDDLSRQFAAPNAKSSARSPFRCRDDTSGTELDSIVLALASLDPRRIYLRPWSNGGRSFSRAARRPSVRRGFPGGGSNRGAHDTQTPESNHVPDDWVAIVVAERISIAHVEFVIISGSKLASLWRRKPLSCSLGGRYQCSRPLNLRFIVLHDSTI
jgi:hypothetical protein